MARYKILWQSSTVISKFTDYRNAIENHANQVLSSDFELDIRGVKKGTNDIHFMAFDYLNNYQVFDSAIKAQKEGYDAFAIGCFLDPILDELREVLDIPVLSLGEAGMLTACMLGKLFSVISYVPQSNKKIYRELVEKYGLLNRSTPFTSFDLPLSELEKGFNNPNPVIERFKGAGLDAIEKGAEVLLPGCGCLNLIIVNGNMNNVGGASVLDVTGALMKLSEMFVILKEVSGTKISRIGYFEKPADSKIEEVLSLYAR